MPYATARRLTLLRAWTYSFPMSEATITPVEMELRGLEQRVDELLALLAQLREENRALRLRQESFSAERAGLLQKNEQVRARVEAMIGRLRTMEQSA
jgi:cell division protein ZapB